MTICPQVSLTSQNVVKNDACIGVNNIFQWNNNEKQCLPGIFNRYLPCECFLTIRTLQTLPLWCFWENRIPFAQDNFSKTKYSRTYCTKKHGIYCNCQTAILWFNVDILRKNCLLLFLRRVHGYVKNACQRLLITA